MQIMILPILLLALNSLLPQAIQTRLPPLRLNITEYFVGDTAKYESFHLKVINDGDSLAVIESVQPSCGCILTTLQRGTVTRGHDGDIYVAITTARIDTLQPIIVDVYTNQNRKEPLRLFIRKRSPTEKKSE
ncbi:MAG: hypothetical protein JWQ98_1483 [Chlorobi bacterium]|nr:hypothetical protein [Chlorobiota bacterium]